MTVVNPKSARIVAVDVLNRFFKGRDYASTILDKVLSQTDQRQRASDLVFGTLRNCTLIDSIIAGLADCPVDRISGRLINIIRVAVYELIHCPLTVEYAIVNEAVDNAKSLGGKKQVGFVNAVLRSIARHIVNRQAVLKKASAKIVPQSPLAGCEFDVDILPDFHRQPAEYLATAFSLPGWLIDGWLKQYGSDKSFQICLASNRRPAVYIRVNRLKTTRQQLCEKFDEAGVDYETPDDESVLRLSKPLSITNLPGYGQGHFSVQDISAQQPVKVMSPQSSWKILDLCAAPGTKTTQLAEMTDDKAQIFATDINGRRLEKLGENLQRLGVKSVKVIDYQSRRSVCESLAGFDAVLVDAPCSNTGVLAKRPEVRFRINQKALNKLTEIQAELLEEAAGMLKTKGVICYSTCSIERCENDAIIEGFLQRNANFRLENKKIILPSAIKSGCDGGYTAILVKK